MSLCSNLNLSFFFVHRHHQPWGCMYGINLYTLTKSSSLLPSFDDINIQKEIINELNLSHEFLLLNFSLLSWRRHCIIEGKNTSCWFSEIIPLTESQSLKAENRVETSIPTLRVCSEESSCIAKNKNMSKLKTVNEIKDLHSTIEGTDLNWFRFRINNI